MKRLDLLRKRFGRLVVTGEAAPIKPFVRRLICLCDCGNTKVIVRGSLVNGDTKSCGCLAAEASRLRAQGRSTHGLSKTLTFSSWSMMMQRCFNAQFTNYERYGGAGITVCDFIKATPKNIFAMLGERPSGYSIDRYPDKAGNYSCGSCPHCKQEGWKLNVRWATDGQQCRNRKSNVMVAWDGETKTATDFAIENGFSPLVILKRIRRGNIPSELLRPLGVRLKRNQFIR